MNKPAIKKGCSKGFETHVQGKRLVAFVVGGMTRSEMRVAHKLSVKLGREILIGSTSCDTPATFLKSLQVWLQNQCCGQNLFGSDA